MASKKGAHKAAAPKTERASSSGAKSKRTGFAKGGDSRTLLGTLEAPVKSVAEKTKAAAAKTKSAGRSAEKAAASLVPSLPDIDIGAAARSIGSQVMSALNTDVGRVMMAELLVHVATSLTKAASKTEIGHHAADEVRNAGAKIGSAVANAGSKVAEAGSAAASSGADAASGATDIAREVVQVAAGAVSGVVADAAQNFMKGRKKQPAARSKSGEPKPGNPYIPKAGNPIPT